MTLGKTPPLPRWQRRLGIIALFIALTALMTWPQARHLATHAYDHQDVHFNLWRLEWIAHALKSAPRELFNGNQFYPERGVLAYSDAMLVEGVLAAPMLWTGVPPVLVHNLMLLGAIVASAAGMYVLARQFSDSAAAGIAAGIIFAFAPYRFDHYMHMELQWTMWMPWAFWALHRTITTGAVHFGLLTGLFVTLQLLSSIYYGMFLGILIAVVGIAQMVPLRGRALMQTAGALALGGTVAATAAAMYSRPYSDASRRVGARHQHEVTMFSARPRDFRRATPDNLVWGTRYGAPERQLFPGLTALILALVGLLLVPPTARTIAYVLGLALAFELSLGMYGELYPYLYEHVSAFRGLRAPARAAIFCLMFLAALAARGYAAVAGSIKPGARPAFAGAVLALLIVEYWVAPLQLVEHYNEPPPLYKWLALQPKGVVAEFPVPPPEALPGHEARVLYMSTFHWNPIVNGYSGYYPQSYLRRLDRLEKFPSAEGLAQLRRDGVRYIIVHSDGYSRHERQRVIRALGLDYQLAHLGTFDDGWGEGAVFSLR